MKGHPVEITKSSSPWIKGHSYWQGQVKRPGVNNNLWEKKKKNPTGPRIRKDWQRKGKPCGNQVVGGRFPDDSSGPDRQKRH